MIYLGATSTWATKEVSSAARGTRKFRVVVSHATAASAQSDPIHVTWDEWAIVGDMIGELSTAVASSRDYSRAEEPLLNCMNSGLGGKSRVPTPAPTYTSFDQILSMYASTTKELMEDGGACAAPSNTMFNTNQRVARAELARLKSGSAEYAGLLDTPHGRQFEANVGNASLVKLSAHLIASDLIADPIQLATPLYESDLSVADTPEEGWLLGTGFDCLPADVHGPSLTLSIKLKVLSCLIMDTPYEFWAINSDAVKADPRFHTWLGFGDWKCTFPAPQGPVPSCRKHDVAYESLQTFAGNASSDEQGNELDKAWNPRNKALADAEYFSDVTFNGCDQQSGFDAWILCGTRTPVELARIYFWGVAKFNTKGWPVTEEDAWHFYLKNEFIECSTIPRMKVEQDGLAQEADGSFTVSWQLLDGCVPGIAIDKYHLCMSVRPANIPFGQDEDCLLNVSGEARSANFTLNPYGDPTTATFVLTAYLFPQNVLYGAPSYGHSTTLRIGY